MSAYTESDQRADTAFLVGVNHGRDSERSRIDARLGSGEVVEAVARATRETRFSSNPTFRAAAAVEAVRAALKEGE